MPKPSPPYLEQPRSIVTNEGIVSKNETPPNLSYPVTSRYSVEYIAHLRKSIHDIITRRYLNNNPNFETVPENILQPMFELYDELFFNNQLSQMMSRTKTQLILQFNNRLTSSGGQCSSKECVYTIELSQPIMLNTFRKGEKSHTSNGLQCYNRLDCIMNVFEHELIHFIIGMTHKHIKGDPIYKSHGLYFVHLMRAYFGHTEFKHSLNRETIYNPGKKEDFKVGDIVSYKSKTGNVVTGKISKLNPTRAIIGDQSVGYQILQLAKDVKEKEIEETGDIRTSPIFTQPVSHFRVGDIISYTIKGETSTDIIKSVNPKTYGIPGFKIHKSIVRAATPEERNRFLSNNTIKQDKTRSDFYLGQSVKFTSFKTGQVVRGTIDKLNPTRAVVGIFTVPYNMLSAL